MSAKLSALRATAVLTLLAAGSVEPVTAQGTTDQRNACMADAFRLCASSIPDAVRIEACLKANRRSLTSACSREVFGGDVPGKRRDADPVQEITREATY